MATRELQEVFAKRKHHHKIHDSNSFWYDLAGSLVNIF
jgi:hypothetical protein